ncbi:hypothetical protein CAPTEDRAFT_192278 [Capitella teleta]|uniref:Uncharacterized protein n=1 Tax=Capitella teleta TaxID=283909 RepID=R7UAS9_CAPTE|nr:hypothetical protein CAPTEDRAFT_192278 [Capitella teleta]|eukprot:ELU03089.1 hypothetical protein CAPTEDRAFT_192278 [Capitella teleta]
MTKNISEEGDKEIYGDIIDTLNEKLPVLPQPLSRNEIDRLHRTGKSSADGKPRPVLIKFTSYQHRLNLMNNQAALTGTNIFLNEDLTRKKNSLLWSARKEKKNETIKDCWSRQIKKLDDLQKLLPRTSTLHEPNRLSSA